jgi:hypothetical protein
MPRPRSAVAINTQEAGSGIDVAAEMISVDRSTVQSAQAPPSDRLSLGQIHNAAPSIDGYLFQGPTPFPPKSTMVPLGADQLPVLILPTQSVVFVSKVCDALTNANPESLSVNDPMKPPGGAAS